MKKRTLEDGIITPYRAQHQIADCKIGMFKKIPNPQFAIRNGEKGVAMAVITVSRQLGSLGTEIAQKVAEVLQYEFVDKEKIGMTLATYGLPELELEKFDEKKPPLIRFLITP